MMCIGMHFIDKGINCFSILFALALLLRMVRACILVMSESEELLLSTTLEVGLCSSSSMLARLVANELQIR